MLPELTALENVMLPGMISGKGKRTVAEASLRDVGLAERMHHLPAELSGGEQQRVAIARALTNNPDIIFADEPTGNLDSKTGDIIIDLLLQLARSRQKTLLVVTHDSAPRATRRSDAPNRGWSAGIATGWTKAGRARYSFMNRKALAGLAAMISVSAAGLLISQESTRWHERGTTTQAPTSQSAAMVERQLRGRGISDPRTLRAMASVPREKFVPAELRSRAYDDRPLPIGYGQTISQPYIVALMTEQIQPKPGQRVLEIGTGSGYQAAVLSELVAEVYTHRDRPAAGAAGGRVVAGAGLQECARQSRATDTRAGRSTRRLTRSSSRPRPIMSRSRSSNSCERADA